MHTLAPVSLVAMLASVALFFRFMRNASPRGLSLRGRFQILRLFPDSGVVTLAQAALLTQDDVDTSVINEFRKSSWILDNLVFDDVVNPAGGGSTLTYGYTRQITQSTAGFRAINSEYTPQDVTKQRFTTDLKPLGGSFQIDRVLDQIAAGRETAFQMRSKITATTTAFQDAVINGDSDTDAGVNGFDGLNKILRGTSTEINANGTVTDWTTALDSTPNTFKALKAIDGFLGYMDGAPSAVFANRAAIAWLVAMARGVNQYTEKVIDFETGGGDGQGVIRQYGNLTLIDPGTKPGSNTDIIPVGTEDVDNTVYALAVTGSPTGGTYTLSVTVNGDTETTTALAYNADAAAVQAALIALSNVANGAVTVTGTSTKTVSFVGALQEAVVVLALGTNSLTGGSSPSVTTTEQSVTTDTTGLTDIYAVRLGLDGFHGVSVAGQQLVKSWLPDFMHAGAVKTGEVELGPAAVVLKATKAAAVLRNVKVA